MWLCVWTHIISLPSLPRLRLTERTNKNHHRRFEEAIEHLTAAVAVMPLVPDVWFLLGLAHMALERWEGALQVYRGVYK